jgi:hypothetical protein
MRCLRHCTKACQASLSKRVILRPTKLITNQLPSPHSSRPWLPVNSPLPESSSELPICQSWCGRCACRSNRALNRRYLPVQTPRAMYYPASTSFPEGCWILIMQPLREGVDDCPASTASSSWEGTHQPLYSHRLRSLMRSEQSYASFISTTPASSD